ESGVGNYGVGNSGFLNFASVTGAGSSGLLNVGALQSGILNLGSTISGFGNTGSVTPAFVSGGANAGTRLSGFFFRGDRSLVARSAAGVCAGGPGARGYERSAAGRHIGAFAAGRIGATGPRRCRWSVVHHSWTTRPADL
ncbi:hypothetical protein OSH38_19445, partial [Mycobacterium ulcerans]